MRRLLATLRGAGDDRGLTLVEVIVAMMIFAVISTGVIYGMISVLTMTHDSRARVVATNLAAAEIDLGRDADELFGLLDEDYEETVNDDVFTVHRTTQWVSDPGLDMNCGSGGGALRYKRVDVTVTWANMRAGTTPVRSNTVINPTTAINDPTRGTILVSVLGASGTGRSGVTVSAVPASPAAGAVALAATPVPTDAQGCSYILKVVPGNYVVTVTRANYIDVDQALTSSTRSVMVGAGTSTSVGFEFDTRATYDLTYGAGYVAVPGEVVRMPSVFTTSFASTHAADGTYDVTPTAAASLTRTVPMYPFEAGYEVFAGLCLAADPVAWPGVAVGPLTYAGVRAAGVATAPGTTVAAAVSTGVVKLALGTAAGGKTLTATSAVNPLAGDPGCWTTVAPIVATTASYTFGTGTGYTIPADGKMTVLLPYGSWRLSWGTGPTAVTAAQMSLPVPAVPLRTTIAATGVVTFDPRVAP